MNKQRKTSHILNVFQYDETTGAVTLPASLSLATPDSAENSTKVATTAWIRAYVGSLSYATVSAVDTAIANLVASAPTTLNTLNELATALGNDPNFATTITISIGTKVPQSRTITINGTAYDLSADRAWTIASGVTSFNTRSGAITLTSGDVTGALGYTPYNSTNPSGYIIGITSGMVTTALGYTPYNSSNPAGYLTSVYGWTNTPDSWYGIGQSTSASGATAVGGYYPWTLSYHTGLAFSAHNAYGGIRFYNQNYPTGPLASTPAMTIINSVVYASNSFRAPIFYDSDDTGYYADFASTSRMNSIVYDNLKFSGDQTYGFLGRNLYADTINGRGSDPLEINYYDGGSVIIGSGANGSKALYAGSLYDAGSRVAISRGEGRNYVEYSRYVYNNGAYSGSGWIEPSDLGVRYANSAGSASSATYLPTAYVGGSQSNPQVYFNYSIGLKVAMTGAWSVWSDTMWINGYAGGDVPWMCALHFLRNSEPRMAISAQQRDSGGYGSYYEVITDYNIGSKTAGTANNLSGFDKTNPSFGAVYASNWFRAQGDCGLYSQDYGGHFRRNTYSYGTWETFGYNKNGYGGIVVNNNYVTAQMHNSSGDFGFLTENGNWWNLFYNNGNNCWGIGTDNTYSGDGFRCIKYGSAQYGWTTWSDRRAKENISSITGALDTVLAMRGVYFNYIQDEAKNKRVGFIAQELEQVLPEAVRYAEEIDEYSVEYAQIVSVLAEAIKEQDVKMTAQEAKIQRLEQLVEQLINQ